MQSRRPSAVVALLLLSCGQNSAETPAPVGVEPVPAKPVPPSPIEVPAPFPAGTVSLRLTKSVSVRLDASEDAKRIGTVAVDTRVGFTGWKKGSGCDKLWVNITPVGWVCGEFLKAETKATYGQEVPILERDEIVPGEYGKITAAGSTIFEYVDPSKTKKKKDKGKKSGKKGDQPVVSPNESTEEDYEKQPYMVEKKPVVGSMNVRKYGEVTVAGKLYWKVSDKANEYVLRSAISQHTPSNYVGSRFGDETGLSLPLGFVWPKGSNQIWVRRKAVGGGVTRQLARRTAISVLEVAKDAAGKVTAYRIGVDEWVDAAPIRMFPALPPPKGIDKAERWIDIDLDSQILVAFEGELPAYATMVSTGAKDTPTEVGVYRMWKKVSETDMNGLNGEDPYSVATVPWTQFFSPEKGLAIHTAYWHDNFGYVRSHGCVNVAPQDARWLYFWSDPQIPPGWSMAAGVIESPGSIVRVRSAATPDPPLRGYAIKVAEARKDK